MCNKSLLPEVWAEQMCCFRWVMTGVTLPVSHSALSEEGVGSEEWGSHLWLTLLCPKCLSESKENPQYRNTQKCRGMQSGGWFQCLSVSCAFTKNTVLCFANVTYFSLFSFCSNVYYFLSSTNLGLIILLEFLGVQLQFLPEIFLTLLIDHGDTLSWLGFMCHFVGRRLTEKKSLVIKTISDPPNIKKLYLLVYLICQKPTREGC